MKKWSLKHRIMLWSCLVSGSAVCLFAGVALLSLYLVELDGVDARLKSEAQRAFEELKEEKVLKDKEVRAAIFEGTSFLHGYIYSSHRFDLKFLYPEVMSMVFVDKAVVDKPFTQEIGHLHVRVAFFIHNGDTLVLAANLRSIRELVEDLRSAYLWSIPIILIAVALGGSWIASRALRPIVEITRVTQQITAHHLGKRIPASETDDEIGRHITVLNGMLDRLEKSFEQASRFAADASHELRTPLTIMRGNLEAAVRSDIFPVDQKPLLNDLLEDTVRLQKIADNLLLLASFDALDKLPLILIRVDLSAIAREAFEDAELLACARRIKLKAELQHDLYVRGDAILLRRLFLNLIDNAVKYNQDGGNLNLILDSDKSSVVLKISNTGIPIDASVQHRLFERFFRSQVDRSRVSGGSGLGLSLCREIARAHGGTISLTQSDQNLTEFTVTLPLFQTLT